MTTRGWNSWGISSPERRRALSQLRPGTIIAVRVQGVWHEGLLSDQLDANGEPRVLHKSKRTYRAAEESAQQYAPDGRELRVIGYPGARAPSLVIGHARARIGEAWSVADNCQRYTRRAHGVPARSPDLEAFFACLFLGFVSAS